MEGQASPTESSLPPQLGEEETLAELVQDGRLSVGERLCFASGFTLRFGSVAPSGAICDTPTGAFHASPDEWFRERSLSPQLAAPTTTTTASTTVPDCWSIVYLPDRRCSPGQTQPTLRSVANAPRLRPSQSPAAAAASAAQGRDWRDIVGIAGSPSVVGDSPSLGLLPPPPLPAAAAEATPQLLPSFVFSSGGSSNTRTTPPVSPVATSPSGSIPSARISRAGEWEERVPVCLNSRVFARVYHHVRDAVFYDSAFLLELLGNCQRLVPLLRELSAASSGFLRFPRSGPQSPDFDALCSLGVIRPGTQSVVLFSLEGAVAIINAVRASHRDLYEEMLETGSNPQFILETLRWLEDRRSRRGVFGSCGAAQGSSSSSSSVIVFPTAPGARPVEGYLDPVSGAPLTHVPSPLAQIAMQSAPPMPPLSRAPQQQQHRLHPDPKPKSKRFLLQPATSQQQPGDDDTSMLYVCVCGKAFHTSQGKAGHCHFCQIHKMDLARRAKEQQQQQQQQAAFEAYRFHPPRHQHADDDDEEYDEDDADGEGIERSLSSRSSAEGDRPYSCICGKTFPTSQAKAGHSHYCHIYRLSQHKSPIGRSSSSVLSQQQLQQRSMGSTFADLLRASESLSHEDLEEEEKAATTAAEGAHPAKRTKLEEPTSTSSTTPSTH